MVRTATLGYPRIGRDRELKRALEAYFRGDLSTLALDDQVRAIKRQNLLEQKQLGITEIPSNDFSLYDHVLDHAHTFGIVPKRVRALEANEVAEYFLMARGREPLPHEGGRASGKARECAALELTKWFDTNYHYLVPEVEPDVPFVLSRRPKIVQEYVEALALGVATRPVLLGPFSLLRLSKATSPEGRALDRLFELVPLYTELLARLVDAGARAVQLDEPCLGLDLGAEEFAEFERAISALAAEKKRPRLLLTNYFGSLGERLEAVLALPVEGVHLDLVSAPEQLDAALACARPDLDLELGVVDGRNVWRTDPDRALELVRRAIRVRGAERTIVASSCSLLHVPLDVERESQLPDEVRSWLSFARQKVAELSLFGRVLDEGNDRVSLPRDSTQLDSTQLDSTQLDSTQLERARQDLASRRGSRLLTRAAVQDRVASLSARDRSRSASYRERAPEQRRRLGLPLLPTTTIGSFPQTTEIRRARREHRLGRMDDAAYERFVDAAIAEVLREQEALGIDLLVHGEAERTDMVEFFAEKLAGCATTEHGWVQSYGTRCVKPPIIYGDVERVSELTLREARAAQRATERPVKGMLTGPVTILKWSFVRDDCPRAEVAAQVALAIRDEVEALERIGYAAIQVDEPALREGLPLRVEERPAYLTWAVDAFRLATSGVRADTQIHTHMCYADFRDVLDALIDMDADVISLETARSHLELLGDFAHHSYPNEVGPGVYDIHSPRVPSREEMVGLLRRALTVIPAERLWVNPDCGLKTRGWPEVRAALANMVSAAREVRAEIETDGRAPATSARVEQPA